MTQSPKSVAAWMVGARWLPSGGTHAMWDGWGEGVYASWMWVHMADFGLMSLGLGGLVAEVAIVAWMDAVIRGDSCSFLEGAPSQDLSYICIIRVLVSESVR